MTSFSLLDELAEQVRWNMWLIRPLSYKPFYETVADHMQVLKTNHLQTLQHLGDLSSMLTNPASILGELERIHRWYRDHNRTRYAAEILDLFSSEWLKLNFQQLPLLRSSQEFAKFASDLGASLNSELGKFTMYSEPFVLSGSALGFSNLRVTVRQVIHLERRWSSFFATLAGLERVGLTPSLSNTYDLVPFSFALNWFTNLRTRMKLGEANLYAPLCFSFRYRVVSYTVEWFPTSDELETRGYFSDTQPIIRVYVREVSKYWPSPSPRAIFDYSGRYPRPDLITLGSLLWSLL